MNELGHSQTYQFRGSLGSFDGVGTSRTSLVSISRSRTFPKVIRETFSMCCASSSPLRIMAPRDGFSTLIAQNVIAGPIDWLRDVLSTGRDNKFHRTWGKKEEGVG